MREIRWLLLLAAIPWLLAHAVSTHAETGGGATAQVKQVLDKAMDIQTRPELSGEAKRRERARLVQKIIAENFLADDMARESIRDDWGRLSGGQQGEFRSLFGVIFQDSYTRMVLNFLQQETIEYRGESPDGKGRLVKTVIMRSNEHIPVDYHLLQRGSRWLIYDVDIDGVSIVETYRNMFRGAIRRGSVDGLLQKMRTQRQAIQIDAAT